MSTAPKSKRIKPRDQKIRIKGRTGCMKFGGWLAGRSTYLRVEEPVSGFVDLIDGESLYRLAKAIVRRFKESQ